VFVRHCIYAAVFAVLVVGCSRQKPGDVPAGSTASPAAQVPAAQAAAAVPQTGTVTGPVLETMDASTYTYVRLNSDKGDIWAAAPQFPVKVGDRVVVALDNPMINFHSSTLNRDFPLLYFASQISPEGAAPGGAGPAASKLMSGHGSAAAQPPAPPTAPMTPPPGGMTIADLWANRKSLAGKTVTVHGTVVKFNGGILGRNWIHLQDGTGKAAEETNDITITAPESVGANVGDTITVTGTVGLDRDIGSGYRYAALIENARIVTK
jgi:hypothetical protein